MTVEALRGDLAALAEDHGEGLITRGEWQAARAPLTARLRSAEAALEAAEAATGPLPPVRSLEAWREAWSAASASGVEGLTGSAMAKIAAG